MHESARVRGRDKAMLGNSEMLGKETDSVVVILVKRQLEIVCSVVYPVEMRVFEPGWTLKLEKLDEAILTEGE